MEMSEKKHNFNPQTAGVLYTEQNHLKRVMAGVPYTEQHPKRRQKMM